MYSGFVKINDVITKIYRVIMCVILAVMTVGVFLEVVFRETGVNATWMEEFIIYLFSWITYFGAAVVLRKDGHLSVTALTGAIKNKTVKKILAIISQLIVFVFCCVVIYYSTQMVGKYFKLDARATNVAWFKMAWIFIQIPINYTVYTLFMIEKIWGTLNGKREVA